MTHRIPIILALPLLALLAGPPAKPAEAAKLESSQIRVDNQLVTVFTYAGQTYRQTTPEGLADPLLVGQLVCIEGKLRDIRGTGFSLFGTDQKFQAINGDVFKGFAPGDNVWLGGRAKAGSLTAHVAVKLKSDLILFDDRFAAANTDKSWEKMLDLAAWISRSATYNPGITFEEHRRYRACRDRAVVAACSLAEAAFQQTDAAGYSRLAMRLFDLDIDREIVWRYLRQAATIDPEQELATRKLAEAGFLRWQGHWLTREQKNEQEAEASRRATRNADLRTERQRRRSEEAASGVALYSREAAELEAAISSLPPADCAIRLASSLERASSPRLARKILLLTAGLPSKLQGQPLAAAFSLRDPEVRCAAIELASTRNDRPARALIMQAAATDSSDEVVELACRILASAADAPSMQTLVELTAAEKEFRARAAVSALQTATNQDRWTPAEWRIWWSRNKTSYPQGPDQ